MDNGEAHRILSERLAEYRQRSYSELAHLVTAKQVDAFETTAPSGACYQLEVQFFWDHRPGGDIRVVGSIDDGGWRAFVPLTQSFIVSPEGKIL
jgi:hypothetical protein